MRGLLLRYGMAFLGWGLTSVAVGVVLSMAVPSMLFGETAMLGVFLGVFICLGSALFSAAFKIGS